MSQNDDNNTESNTNNQLVWIIPISLVGVCLLIFVLWYFLRPRGSQSKNKKAGQYLADIQAKYMQEFWPTGGAAF